MSTIYNTVSGATVTGTADADSVDNIGNEVIISTDEGNDTITNYSTNNTLYTGRDATIYAGAGNDSIANHGANVYIDGEGGDDVINNSSYGTRASIRGAAGNDSIRNSGTFAIINGKDGNDTITNTNLGANSTIIGNAGDDYIITSGANYVYVHGGAGADTIYSTGTAQGVTVHGGAGNDTLIGDSVNTYGVVYQYANGTGDDRIYNYNSNDTILIDAAADYQTLSSGNNLVVSLSAGSITLVNAKDETLNITGGTFAGIIRNGTSNTTVTGTARNDSIVNYADSVKIFALEGNDIIENMSGENVIIDVGSGNDTVNNLFSEVTIEGGAGDDYIKNYGGTVSISGGAGNDTVSLLSSNENITISGGAGNDLISNDSSIHSGRVYQYAYGDGYDTILNYNSNDTISIGGTVFYETLTSGNNIIVTIDSAAGQSLAGGIRYGTITLVNAKDKTLNITGGTAGGLVTGTSRADTLTNYSRFVTIAAGAGNDSIYNEGAYVFIDAGAGNDTVSLGTTAGIITISGGAGNDYINDLTSSHSGRLYYYAQGDGNDTVKNFDYYADTISVGGFADYQTLTSGNNLVVSLSSGSITLLDLKGKNLNIKGGTFIPNKNTLPAGLSTNGDVLSVSTAFTGSTISADDYNVKNVDATALSKGIYIYGDANKNSIRGGSGADHIYAGADNDTVLGGAGNDYVDGNAGNDYINGGDGNDTLWGSEGNDYIYGEAGNDFLGGEAGNDYLSGGTGNDTLSGGTGKDTLWGGAGKDVFIYSSGDDVITDFDRLNDKISLSSATISSHSIKGSDLVFKTNAGSLTLKNSKNVEVTIGSSIYYNNIVYDNKKTSATLSAGFTGTLRGADYVSSVKNIYGTNLTKGVGIYGNSNANYIYGGSYNDIINSSAGNDTLRGFAGNDRLYGDSGNDILDGDAGNDTLFGGSGNDTFRYYNNEGNDVIADFTTDDKIYLVTGTISSASLKSSDMVFKVGSNTLTVKDGKNKEIAIGDYIYYNDLIYDSKKTRATVSSSFTGSLTADAYADSIYFINATAVSKGAKINGNVKNNYIYTGSGTDLISGSGGNDHIYAGSGNDALYGGTDNDVLYGQTGNDLLDGDTGNDTLYGGAGNDTFRYYGGEGNDVIADYESADKINLHNVTISSASVKGSDLVFNVGRNTLTVKNGKDKEIAIGDNIYYNNVIYDSKKTRMSLPASFSGTLRASDYSSSVKSIFAYNVTKGFTLYGNAQNNDIYGGYGADTIFGGAGNDWIVGNSGNDKLYGDASNDTLFGGNGTNTLYGGAGNDVFVYNTATPGKDVIADFADGDKISITGSSGTSVTSVTFSGTDTTFNIGSGSVVVKNSKNKEITLGNKIYYNNLMYDSKKIYATLAADFSGTLSASDYPSSVKNIYASTTTKNIGIIGNSNANIIFSGSGNDSIYTGKGNDYVYAGNGNDYLFGDAGNDTLNGGSGKDTLFGAAGNDTLYGGSGDDVFWYVAGNDVIADFESGEKIVLRESSASVSSVEVKNSDMVFKIGSGSLTVQNSKDKNIVIDNTTYKGYLTYSSNMATVTVGAGFTGTLNSSDYDSAVRVIWARPLSNTVNIVGNSNANTIYGSTNTNMINGGAGNDDMYGGNGKDTFYGGAGDDTVSGLNGNDWINGGDGNDYLNGGNGNDFINGNGGNDLIFGGNDDDTIWGDAGNDTLYGNAGKDVFCFSANSGADVIGDFEDGDSIKLYGTGASISSVAVKGSDVVYKFGTGTITVQNGKDKDIKVGDSIYRNQFIYNENKTAVTIKAGGVYTRDDFEDSVVTVNAAALSQNVTISGSGKTRTIYGGSGNDSLFAYGRGTLDGGAGNDNLVGGSGDDSLYGGAGNDTLFGYPGNDTLTGGAGKDYFWNSLGNNVITDYTAGEDTIRFVAQVTSTTYSGNDVIFNFGSDSLTVKNGKGKKITTVYNGKTTTKTYNTGVSARTLDLLDDNNFISNDTSLDSITEKKFAVTQIQSENTFALAQDLSFLAYSKEK